MDVTITLVDTALPVLAYGAIVKIPSNVLFTLHAQSNLTHIECYMNDVIFSVQGDPESQHRVFDGTLHSLKWHLPSLPGETNKLVIMESSGRGRLDEPAPRNSWCGRSECRRDKPSPQSKFRNSATLWTFRKIKVVLEGRI